MEKVQETVKEGGGTNFVYTIAPEYIFLAQSKYRGKCGNLFAVAVDCAAEFIPKFNENLSVSVTGCRNRKN